jgi:hypothetical protein
VGVELMPLNRYVITQPVTVPAGTPATPAAGEPGTGAQAGYGSAAISAGYAAFPQAFQLVRRSCSTPRLRCMRR